MPELVKPAHEHFAALIASGTGITKAYVSVGYSEKGAPQGANRLLKRPEIVARIEELKAGITNGLQRLAIREIDERVQRQQDRWDRMQRVIDERGVAPEFQKVAGGKTGLLVRRLKQIGSGDSAQLVEEFEVDTGLLSEIRKLEEHTAYELGQRVDQASGPQVQIALLMPSAPAEAPVQVVDIKALRK
jgi:hypothetical protein